MRDNRKKLLELLDESGESLYALFTKLTLSQDIAEELMQELFIKLNNSKAFQKCNNMTAYAHRAAINLAFDWRRSRKRVPLTLEQMNEPASENNSPLDKLIQNEQIQEILNAIAQLKGIFREVVVMRYIQQMPNDSIAEHLGKTAHQIRALCYKALTRLREMLGACGSISFEKELDNAKK